MSHDSVVLSYNPIAYWKCQELVVPLSAPNTFFTDSSGHGLNGTLQPNSAAGLTVGNPGPVTTDPTSYSMGQGIARIPSLGNNSGILYPQFAQSWECLFMRPDPDPSDGVHTLMNRGGDATNTYLSIAQRSTGNYQGCLIASLDFGGGHYEGVISCVVTPNVFHHGVITFDGVSTLIMYVDSYVTDVNTNCPPTGLTDNSPWRIGYITNLVFGAVFRNYLMGYAAFYDYVLTPFQVANLNASVQGTRMLNPCGPSVIGGCP